jgi:glycosyltransferase involved in cell wall biosynthesis
VRSGVPRVSVLVPVYNAESTLEVALLSVRRQRFSDWECIVVDDGSTDSSLSIAERVAREDGRIRSIRISRSGIVAALNTGIDACRGEFIARMDADDWMHADRLMLQVEALSSASDLAGVGCHVRLFPRQTLTPKRVLYEQWLNSLKSARDVKLDRFVECPIAHPTLFIRRTVLARFRYREVDWAEDYDLVLRLLGADERLGMVPLALLYWRDGARRLSRTSDRYSQARFVECKAHFLRAGWLSDHERYVLWGYGDTGRRLSRALARLGRLPSHIVELHPGRIGQRIGGAPVISVEALAELEPRPQRIVASVAGSGPRGEIRVKLKTFGFVEERDFVCTA